MTLSTTSYTYDGNAKRPGVTVENGDVTLVEGADYVVSYRNNTNVGTAEAEINGKRNYVFSVSKYFTIKVKNITPTVELSAYKYTYDGGVKTPAVTVKDGSTTLTKDKDYTVSYPAGRKNTGTYTIRVVLKGNYSGSQNASFQIVAPVAPSKPSNNTPKKVTTNAMYRLYNPNSGEHFYTASASEKNHLATVGWRYEGVAWNAPKSGSPVYRLYNPNSGDHHYTTSAGEKNHLTSVGWRYEGIGWYSGGGKPLYRAYNPNCTGAGSHHYTTSAGEKNNLVSIGWRYEGVAWYGY